MLDLCLRFHLYCNLCKSLCWQNTVLEVLAGKWGVPGARRTWPGHAHGPQPGRIPVVSLRAFIACTLLCRGCCLPCIFRQYFLVELLLPVYKCKSCFVSEFMFTFGVLCSDVHVVAQHLLNPAELSRKAVGLSALSWQTGGSCCCQPKHPGICSCSLPALSVQMANIAEL